MATSIKRVVIMMFFINLLIVLSLGIANNIENTTQVEQELNNNVYNMQNWTTDFGNNYYNVRPDSQTVQLDKSAGDVKYGQFSVFKLLQGGVEYLFLDDPNASQVERYLNKGVLLFIAIINVLGGLDILFIAYSKKYD